VSAWAQVMQRYVVVTGRAVPERVVEAQPAPRLALKPALAVASPLRAREVRRQAVSVTVSLKGVAVSQRLRRLPVPGWPVSLQVAVGAELVNRGTSRTASLTVAVVAVWLAPEIPKRLGILVWAAESLQLVAVD
jgi:hypothetical protein